MPSLSPTMTEGNLTKWLVKEGDLIKAGDVIAEIETDKATMEVETVDEGVIEKLLFEEGKESIPVNSATLSIIVGAFDMRITKPISPAKTSIIGMAFLLRLEILVMTALCVWCSSAKVFANICGESAVY